MEGFGPSGETILEYSLYDAYRAGFRHFVFIIRKEIEADFRDRILSRLPDYLHWEICYQELDLLPRGFSVPAGRKKPWGTGHAVWVARDKIPGSFAIVNGDDFYGRSGFEQLVKFFDATESVENEHCLVGYPLGRTLSDAGSISRGICVVSDDQTLVALREVHGIRQEDGQIVADSESPVELVSNTAASMNLFGFKKSVFEAIDRDFMIFLEQSGSEMKSEFYIPSVVNGLLEEKSASFRVLNSADDWMGVTNPDDRSKVEQGIQSLVDQGVYKPSLWK